MANAASSSRKALLHVLDRPLVEARTTAATALPLVGLYLILTLEATSRRRGALVGALCLLLGVMYFVVVAVPFTRSFYALVVPGPAVLATAWGRAALVVVWLRLTDERFRLGGAA